MANPTTSTKLWTYEKLDFQTLLGQYYRAFAAEEAYNRFFGETQDAIDPEFTYERWSEDIKEKTKTNHYVPVDAQPTDSIRIEGIADRGQAKAAIDGANFSKNRNEFRKVGILTGIDPEAFPSFEVRVSPNGIWEELVAKEGSTQENIARDDIMYNTGVSYEKVVVGGSGKSTERYTALAYQDYVNIVGTPSATWPPKYLSFSQPLMVQYLVNRTYDGTNKTYQSTKFEYQLAQLLVGDVLTLVTAEKSANSDDSANRGYDYSLEFLQRFATQVNNPSGLGKLPTALIDNIDKSNFRHTLLPAIVLYASDVPEVISATDSFITQLIGSLPATYDPTLRGLMVLEPKFLDDGKLFEGPTWEKIVAEERDAILSFFNVKDNPAPLSDAPEFDNFDQILTDKEVGEDFEKEVIAARQNLSPRDMQCYLLENIRSITNQRAPGGKYAPNYKNVKTISTGGQPALLTNYLRHGKNTADIDTILDLCPDVYAVMQPYIRIFRVDYDEKGNVLQIPVKKGSKNKVDAEAELIIPNFLNKKDVASILLGTRGRAAGSGLKSFSWSLDGTQPAEVDNNIKATIQIYFQSVSDFFNGVSQAGAVDANGFPQPNFLDLIVNSPSIRKNKDGTTTPVLTKILHREYKGANFRIKARVGWARPDPHALHHALKHRGGTLTDAGKLADLIEDTQTTLFLQCIRHNLDFRQDGTVQMDISYVAGLAGVLSSPQANILAPPTESILYSLSQVDEELEETADQQNLTPRQAERKKELLEERKKINQQDRLIKYKKLLGGLFSSTDSKVYQLPVDINDMLRQPWSQLSDAQRAQRAKRKQGEAKNFLMTNPQQLNLTLLNAVGDSLSAGGEDNGAAAFSEAEQKRYQEIQNRSTQFKFVPFMFLGDLLDNVIEQTTINNKGEKLNFTTFLSDTDLIDPLMALQLVGEPASMDVDLRDIGILEKLRASDPLVFRDANGIVFSVNIGDIPISVDAFQVWFKDNVIKKDMDKFYLLYFIKKLCADLIVKAFQSDCFGEDLRMNQRFDAHPVSYVSDSTAIQQPLSARQFGQNLQIKTSTPTSKTHNAIVVLPTDSRPGNLSGNYDKDKAEGIHHHHIGAPCGLLKKISFSRMDQEYLRQANIEKEGALGPEQLRELYNVTIEMVGNSLYENGMYIYISPTLMDAHKMSLDYLGLHGYYLITSVASKVTSAGFTTTIQALHQAVDFTGNSALIPEFYDLPAEPPLPGHDPTAAPPVYEPGSVGAAAQEAEDIEALQKEHDIRIAKLDGRADSSKMSEDEYKAELLALNKAHAELLEKKFPGSDAAKFAALEARE